MTLDEYKMKVADYLDEERPRIKAANKKLMKEYEPDFQEFLESKLSPAAAGLGMVMHYL